MEFEKLQQIIAEVLNIDPDTITVDSRFIDDLSADSLDIFEIITSIEDAFIKMLTQSKMVDTYYGDGNTSTFVIEKLKAWLNTRKA